MAELHQPAPQARGLAMARVAETDLYAPVKAFLQAQGFEVKAAE